MINRKDVIRMRVPYPSVSDQLALRPHMYICKKTKGPEYKFVKCQTLKPYMLFNNTMQHYCDETPDITRNPFQRTTRIDCDKIFVTNSVEYNIRMRTTSRPDVCDDLFDNVIRELNNDDYQIINVNETELRELNPLISAL